MPKIRNRVRHGCGYESDKLEKAINALVNALWVLFRDGVRPCQIVGNSQKRRLDVGRVLGGRLEEWDASEFGCQLEAHLLGHLSDEEGAARARMR